MQQEMLNRFQAASAQEGYNSLVELVATLQTEGLDQIHIYVLFEQYMLFLRAQDREQEGDKVTDVMDRIVGWCSPHMRLFSSNITNEEIMQHKQKERT